MERSKVLKFANDLGYGNIGEEDHWNGYEVYQLIYNKPGDENVYHIGLPHIVMIKGDKIRISTDTECFEYLDHVIAKDIDPEEEARERAYIKYLEEKDKKK